MTKNTNIGLMLKAFVDCTLVTYTMCAFRFSNNFLCMRTFELQREFIRILKKYFMI